MSRISLKVTPEEHQRLKALAALRGKSIKDYVIERTLGAEGDKTQQSALDELESLLDERIRKAQNGWISRRTVGAIFKARQARSVWPTKTPTELAEKNGKG